MKEQTWRLPDGVDELLPPAAWELEQLRRSVLDVFYRWGFEYVEPPIVEYLDSLMVGSGNHLDLQTLKVVDQTSGRMLGVRADMTSQAARIDAHGLARKGPQRLCYAGTVVHATRPGVLESRVPVRAGAEIFGVPELRADAEVIALLVEVFAQAKIDDPVFVLGHMGIYEELVRPLELDETSDRQLFAAVQVKSETDIAEMLPPSAQRDMLIALPSLMGSEQALQDADRVLANADSGVHDALESLRHLAGLVHARCPEVTLRFDVAELSGYGYHNGPVFSAYQADQGRAVARGGRYDGVGAAFGRHRAATGFDVNLKPLIGRGVGYATDSNAIFAPIPNNGNEHLWRAAVAELRAQGERVIVGLQENEPPTQECRRLLVPGNDKQGETWTLQPLPSA